MKQILCYGDSNTWGLIPGTNQRYAWGVRWTSLLQNKGEIEDFRVIEEGLCGRTTVFEDLYRENRNGRKTLPLILESHSPIDFVVLMLGTNDCKSHYKVNAYEIAKGLEQCIDKILEVIPAEKLLVVSPIHLGRDVWRPEFDPEFDQTSVEVSQNLAEEYRNLAIRKEVHFLAASEYASPSPVDQEHMDENGHRNLAEAVFQKIHQVL